MFGEYRTLTLIIRAVTKCDLIPPPMFCQKLIFRTQTDKWTDGQTDGRTDRLIPEYP